MLEGTGLVRRKKPKEEPENGTDPSPLEAENEQVEAEDEAPAESALPHRTAPEWARPSQAWRVNMVEDPAMKQLAFLLFLILGGEIDLYLVLQLTSHLAGWLLLLAHLAASFWLWFCVVTIPMARLNLSCTQLLLSVSRLTVHTGAPHEGAQEAVLYAHPCYCNCYCTHNRNHSRNHICSRK